MHTLAVTEQLRLHRLCDPKISKVNTKKHHSPSGIRRLAILFLVRESVLDKDQTATNKLTLETVLST